MNYKDHRFVFGGIDSHDYGLIVSNDSGFDSPERDVTEVKVPGRNGSLILDNGRFENQRVVYNCVLTEDFTAQANALRAALMSQEGYQRLTDTFRPDVYRMGRIVEVTAKPGSRYENGQLTITFDCKPQKFLLTGETAVAVVASGGRIENPTAFGARPLLEVWGYGGILIDGAPVVVDNATFGHVVLADGPDLSGDPVSVRSLYEEGDPISVNNVTAQIYLEVSSYPSSLTHSEDSGLSFVAWYYAEGGTTNHVLIEYNIAKAEFTAQQNPAQKRYTSTVTIDGGAAITVTFRIGYQNFIAFSGRVSADAAYMAGTFDARSITAESSLSVLGAPTYIDLDIGEAWAVKNDEAVVLNNAVSLPTRLPELAPGENIIEFDSTITQLQVVPRWWTI